MNLWEAERLAKRLIAEHNPGIGFGWSRAKTTFGDYSDATKTIRLSRILTPFRSEDEIRVTVMHEIAHSIVGAREGHGKRWRNVMLSFGLPPDRCTEFQGEIPGGWVSRCPNGHVGTKVYHRKPSRERSCGRCSPKFDVAYLLRYVKRS